MIFGFLGSEINHYWKNLVTLCRNPTSIWLLIQIFLQIFAAFFISSICPLIIRHVILPSSIQREEPLNLVFSPCMDDLHGACSYPSASLDTQNIQLFSSSITYSLTVRLNFADLESNAKMGLFQNKLAIYDKNDAILGEWYKTAYVKQPSLLTKIMWVSFFPLYFAGFFHDHQFLEILFTDDFVIADANQPYKLTYTLQDRYPQVDSATLVSNARFGIIRHILYNWPIISYLIIFMISLFATVAFIFLYWGRRVYVSRSNEPVVVTSEPVVSRSDSSESLKMHLKHRYIPDNVDELPECPDLENFPGWNNNSNLTEFEMPKAFTETSISNSVRKRKP